MSGFKRRKKLIKPRLQLKLVSALLVPAFVSLCAQAIFVSTALASPEPGSTETFLLSEQTVNAIQGGLFFSALLALALGLAIGILTTFRIAGPIYRFETYLGQLAAGTTKEPCRIRSRDELHDLCAAINLATEPLRGDPSQTPGSASEGKAADLHPDVDEFPAPFPSQPSAHAQQASESTSTRAGRADD